MFRLLISSLFLTFTSISAFAFDDSRCAVDPYEACFDGGANSSESSPPEWTPTACDLLKAEMEQDREDLNIAIQSVKSMRHICSAWTLPYECPAALYRQQAGAKRKLAQTIAAFRRAGCR